RIFGEVMIFQTSEVSETSEVFVHGSKWTRPPNTRSKPLTNSPAATGLRSRGGRSRARCGRSSCVDKSLLKMERFWQKRGLGRMFGHNVIARRVLFPTKQSPTR